MGREGRDYWEAQLSEYWDSGLTIQEYSELKELPASLIFLAVCSINMVFSMIHLAFQSPEGMTSACSGRWFMV